MMLEKGFGHLYSYKDGLRPSPTALQNVNATGQAEKMTAMVPAPGANGEASE